MRTTVCDQHIDLGMTDEKGRKVGAAVLAWVDNLPGIAVRVNVTRDGAAFGPVPKPFRVGSVERAHIEIDRRVEAMAKRYAERLGVPVPTITRR